MKRIKRLFLVFVLAMMFTSVVGSTMTVYAKKINYSKREKTAKKNLKKKVRKMLKRDFYKPSCSIRSSKRSGKTLTCYLMCSIGGGACDFKVKVNLKTGVATFVYDSEGIFINEDNGRWDDDAEGAGGYVGKYKFKIKVK